METKKKFPFDQQKFNDLLINCHRRVQRIAAHKRQVVIGQVLDEAELEYDERLFYSRAVFKAIDRSHQ